MNRIPHRKEADVPDVIERIHDLKTQAKNRRDMRRWQRAVSLLQEAIALGTEEFGNARGLPEWQARMAAELADCWGILGGVERRWAFELAGDKRLRLEHLDRSIAAYDEGYRYEQMDPGRQSTYNRLNRLIVRLLRDPQVLADDRGVASREAVDVRAELEALADEIGGRSIDNAWSALDVALLNVLLGRQDAASAYAPFERMRAPDFARQSALDVVAPLAELDLPAGPELRRAEQRLRRGMA
jgi:hypothetical protein